MVQNYSDNERGYPLLPLHELLCPISSKVFFICTIPDRIAQPLLHQLWRTGWNEKQLYGSTMKDRSNDPSHHEEMLLPQSYISLPVYD